MTLSTAAAHLSVLEEYDRSLRFQGLELSEPQPLPFQFSNPVEAINAGVPVSVAVARTKEERTCGTCGKASLDYVKSRGRYIRCKLCNNLNSRMHRVLTRRTNEGLRIAWFQLSQGERSQFRRTICSTIGPAGLEIEMGLHVVRSRPTCAELDDAMALSQFDEWLQKKSEAKAHRLQEIENLHMERVKSRSMNPLHDNYDDQIGETTQEVEVPTTELGAVGRWFNVQPPKCEHAFRLLVEEDNMLETLKAKLVHARARADAALAEDGDFVVPPLVRQILIQTNKELETMTTEIDCVANGDHPSLDPWEARRKTIRLVNTHEHQLLRFRKVRKSIKKSEDELHRQGITIG